ncbi:hypothetical protein V5799_012888 [Amblyomma americanum]|uniref:Hexosyltransferase n=1 Tax=Amblyomma americanum TaxID=6943 RepID=A0AAQ4E7D6_AMBAM
MLTWEIAPMLSPHSQLAFPGVNLLDPTAKVFAERCDSYEPRLPHRGGWAVAERCLRPLDMLVFAHCSVREWRRHAALRDTLFEDTALRRLNWTRVFFSGRPSNNKDLNAWLDLEADLTGDLVVLPFKNGNFNITPKFVEGMRWVDDHCPTVQKVIKIDDGVMIHPFKDDGYGFGDLALAVGIGHVELQRFMEWNENRTDCVSYGICMLTLEGTKYGANSRRRGQWGLLL